MSGFVARLDTDNQLDRRLLAELAWAIGEIKRLEERVAGLLDANNREVERRREADRITNEFVDAFRWGGNISKPTEGTWNRSQLDRALKMARERGAP
jgi:hypothetical protein